jgi:phage terminase large subunit-like protein
VTALLTGRYECGFTLPHSDGSQFVCEETGPHFCEARAGRAVGFFHEILVHTKGSYARKPFNLAPFQANDIVRPLMGTTVWSEEFGLYRRQFQIAWIEIARKNGKSELLAGILLYLLCADFEEGAEIYGVARNRDQAGLVYNVARRMVELSPVLSKRLQIRKAIKRIFDPRTDSFYQVIPADADSALGSNPHGLGADEILAWPNGDMWTNTRSGMGSAARIQPMMVALTTAGRDLENFAGLMHKEMARVAEQPERSPHIFPYLRNLPMDADPWDEKNWYRVNEALTAGFLSVEEFRRQANEARNNPILESQFRQFKLNQWQASAVQWMRADLWENAKGTVHRSVEALFAAFEGRECWMGIDLAARRDLTSICYLFPDPDDDEACDLIWRHYACEAAVADLDVRNSDRFSREFDGGGWLTVTPGTVLDFERVYSDVQADARRFQILGGDADLFSSDPVIQKIEEITYVDGIMAYKNTFDRMTDGMKRLFEMTLRKKLRHHGNPLATFCFLACEAVISKADPDQIRPHKPNRDTAAKRIDAVPAAILAVNAWKGRGGDVESLYAEEEVLVL